MILNNLRIDGRKFEQLRSIEISRFYRKNFLVLNYKQGLTNIQVELGPTYTKHVNIEVKNTYEPERSYRFILYRINEIFRQNFLLPINITAYIIYDGGSLFSSLINSISLCAVISGVPMHDIFIGVTVGYMHNTVLYDLNDYEQKSKMMKIDSIFAAGNGENFYFYFKGNLSMEEIEKIYEESRRCSIVLHKKLEEYLKKLIYFLFLFI